VVLDPVTLHSHRLLVRFARSETEGPLFEEMSAQLEAMASLIGMKETLRLDSADVFEVLRIERVEGDVVEEPPSGAVADGRPDAFQFRFLRSISQSLARAPDLDGLFRSLFTQLDRELGLTHMLLLLVDEPRGRLFTIASHGYPEEGLGSEVRFGDGILGTAAKTRKSMRVGDIGGALRYTRAVAGGRERGAVAEVAPPGLKQVRSCMAIPLQWYGELVGVLAAEIGEARRVLRTRRDAARHRRQPGGARRAREAPSRRPRRAGRDAGRAALEPRTRRFTFYREDESIFVDGDYLIRYVPAQILWRLLQLHAGEGRVDFTNRELRMDPAIRCPR